LFLCKRKKYFGNATTSKLLKTEQRPNLTPAFYRLYMQIKIERCVTKSRTSYFMPLKNGFTHTPTFQKT